MTHDEFRNWLSDEVAGDRMTQSQMDDLIEQKAIFDETFRSGLLQKEFRMHVVGYVAQQRRVARSLHELLDSAKSEFPGRMTYFEPIGFTLL